MTDTLHGLPYWELRFDGEGDPDAAQRDAFLSELPGAGVSDLFVFSHGWNNSPDYARRLYDRFFGLLAKEAGSGSGASARIGLVGVIWPSMRWADEEIPDFAPLAAAGFGDTGSQMAETFVELRALFAAPEQQAALERMEGLLRDEPDDPELLAEFQRLMGRLGDDGGTGGAAEEDAGELSLVRDSPESAFGRFLPALEQDATAAPDEGGAAGGFLDPPAQPAGDDIAAAGFGDLTKRLWKGAKQALRQFTYFQMKKRAGIVGERGLGPLIGDAHEAVPSVRVHLVGHSFGARLVSYALAGLPAASPSPVKSLLLLQGAFSHFAFASKLPHRDGSGALAGRMSRVDGPLVAVHSVHDSAVGVLYPIASRGSGEDAASFAEQVSRWGAMGYHGAQAVAAAQDVLRQPGSAYTLAAGGFTNVDARDVVRTGGPPSGAHSDIFHPELAWLALSAAGLTRR